MKQGIIKKAVFLFFPFVCLGCAANWWYVLYVVVGLLVLFVFVYVLYKLYSYCKGIRHARAYASKFKDMCVFLLQTDHFLKYCNRRYGIESPFFK